MTDTRSGGTQETATRLQQIRERFAAADRLREMFGLGPPEDDMSWLLERHDMLDAALREQNAKLHEALKTYGQHRRGCPHPSCGDCGTHTMAPSKTPGYSYCTRCGRGSIPTSNETCDCGFDAALEVRLTVSGGGDK